MYSPMLSKLLSDHNVKIKNNNVKTSISMKNTTKPSLFQILHMWIQTKDIH